MKLSIIIPVYNGAATIARLVDAVKIELSAKHELEFVLINDCSPRDNSAEVCLGLAKQDARIKFLDLSKNFGEHNAVMAGLNYCTGEAAVIIDDDFQNQPSDITKLIDKLAEGHDVVFSRYEKKEHDVMRNLGSQFTNLVASLMIPKPIELYLSSFKIINRFLIDELINNKSPYPYIDGLILRVTKSYATVLCNHQPRKEGCSGYTFRKLISLWLNMFTSFSILPLRMATYLGFLVAVLGFGAAIEFAIVKILHPDVKAGWTSLMTAILVLSGVQLMALGVIGEYLGRMYLKVGGKPQFVIRRVVNCTKHNEQQG